MIEIRRYQDADRDGVWELHNRALDAVDAHAGNGPWDDDLNDIQRVYLEAGGEFLVGLLDDRIVAMGAILRVDQRTAQLRRMRVHPNVWRRGFGQAILDALDARARHLGYGTLVLDTTVGQTAAQALYRRNGFTEVRRTVIAGFDSIEFEKQLSNGPWAGGSR